MPSMFCICFRGPLLIEVCGLAASFPGGMKRGAGWDAEQPGAKMSKLGPDAILTARQLTPTPAEIDFRSLPGPRHLHFGCVSL